MTKSNLHLVQAARYGGWMQVYSGGKFYPLDPRPEEIFIEDIAHSLSLLCRYVGHINRFYCPTPEQRILTSNLDWVEAETLFVGQKLIGFDETPIELGQAGKKRRKFRPAQVTAVVPVKRDIIRLELSDGSTVRTAKEHPWLVATKLSRNQQWLTAERIATDIAENRKRYMHKFIEPWKFNTSREAGWLSGMYDGEGYFSFLNRGGVQLGICQKEGLLLEEIKRLHTLIGFCSNRLTNTGTNTVTYQLKGGWREMMRLIGTLKPLRLLNTFKTGLESGNLSKQLNGLDTPLQVVKAYNEGEEWVIGIETDTHTYFSEGFGAHNSVAEHCWLVSHRVSEENALWALLHDATEAYLSDISHPLKYMPEMKIYKEIEKEVQKAICVRFGLPEEEPKEVKDIENRLLKNETRDLFKKRHPEWNWKYKALHNLYIAGYEPQKIEKMYLERFYELGGKYVG